MLTQRELSFEDHFIGAISNVFSFLPARFRIFARRFQRHSVVRPF